MSNWTSFRPKPNYFWSIISVGAVLFMFGLFGLITLHSDSFMQSLKEEFEIIVELNPKASEKQIEHLIDKLEQEEGILQGSVKFTSKEEGLALLSEDLGPELLDIEMPNPLTDIISFRMDGAAFDLANLDKIKAHYSRGYPEVLSVYYQEGLVESIVSNLDKVALSFLTAGILLSLLAFMLIYNSIRLSIYANRFLIRNMELVGASWSFIRRPFLKKSLVHGLVSSLLAISGLALFYYIAASRLPELLQYLQLESILYLLALLAVVGIVINVGSTWLVVTRFLGMSSNELHH